MYSGSSVSSNNVNDDSYGQGEWQHSSSYNETQQPAQDGMTTQPSVGRFNEQDKATAMFVRKPATPTLAPFNEQDKATAMFVRKPATPTLAPFKDSSFPSGSGVIVNLRAAPRAEGKMNKTSSKGKK